MKYPDGTCITVGDPIWWNEGERCGRVASIIETEEEWLKWGLDEPGIFICTDFSRKTLTEDVFNSEEQLEDEGIVRITSEEEKKIFRLFSILCAQHPFEANKMFTVINRKIEEGWQWQFLVSDGPAGQRYYNLHGNSTFVRISYPSDPNDA